MNFEQVRYFLAICEERSFSRAAERCSVRQPSISKAIAGLEAAVGGALFVRSRPVALSQLGHGLLPLFRQLDAVAKQIRTGASVVAECKPGGQLQQKIVTPHA